MGSKGGEVHRSRVASASPNLDQLYRTFLVLQHFAVLIYIHPLHQNASLSVLVLFKVTRGDS